jgi:hypothetical protein
MKKLMIFVLIIFVLSGMSFAKDGKGKEERDNKADKAQKRESKQQQKKEQTVEQERVEAKERVKKQERVSKEKVEKSSGAAETESKKGKIQKHQSINEQIAHEKSKHETRLAKLSKMKELAEGDEKTLARVNKLMEKENKRFIAKMAKLDERGTGVSDEELAEVAKKGEHKVKDKNKDKDRAADKGEQPEPDEE